ncbi:hypothetical protein GCM10017767_16770 [Halomonas urumqiensis]|nr:hypothetical protein GCM10017767_16770 [Halomonas urumqiensis]
MQPHDGGESGVVYKCSHANGALTSSVLMVQVARLTDDMDLPDGVRQGLESLTATLAGAAVGNTSGGAMAFNLDAHNRQLHSFE